jgi:Flp pilus assembly protein TadD
LALVLLAGCGTSGSRPADVADRRADDAILPPVADPDDSAPSVASGAPSSVAPSAAPSAALTPPVEVPERALTSYARALNAMNAEDWFQAEVEFEQLIVEYPAYPGPYVNLAILYRRDNRVDEAEFALNQALAIAPEHPAANSELGVIYRERGDFADAESAYRRALEGDPSYALAHYNLGILYDIYLKREADALEHYEAYLSVAARPDAEVERWVVDLRRRLGIPAETAQVARENGT